MKSLSRIARRSWFLPLRLASYVIIMAVVVLWMAFPGFLQLPFVIYSLLTLGFSLLIAFDSKQKLAGATSVIIGLQFVMEVVLESGIIYATGNINSPYSALFLLTIVSAGLAYRLVGTLLMASLVSTAYAFIIWFGLYQTTDPALSLGALQTIFSATDSVFYSIFLHILIFYLVAFISGYLAEHLERQNKQLADTSLALKKAKLETGDILRNINSGLLSTDTDGRIIYFNPAAERILGYREEDVKGLHCTTVFAERMPLLAECLLEQNDHSLSAPRIEIQITNAANDIIPLGISITTLREEQDCLRGTIAIFTDLTEAKKLEEKIRTADRMAAIGELSASIAHELRNPLAAISGSVEVLSRELELSHDNARLMHLIVKESNRLNNIVGDFLAYARVDRTTYNRVELCHLVSEVLEIMLHHDSYSPEIEIDFETVETVAYVMSDEELIKQVLLNLTLNACESFAGQPGRVLIKLTCDVHNDQVLLSVTDNGPGISRENRQKIYTPFFSTKKNGTGLGLSIVHRICSILHLKINVSSEPGEGTRFTIQFSGDRVNPSSNPQKQSSLAIRG